MSIINIIGILLDVAVLFALVLAIKKFDKPLSKIFLIFLGLSTTYYLTLILGGEKVKEWFLNFQNGMGNYVGFICIVITLLLALAMTFQWMVDWFSNRLGWNESRKEKMVPLIWLIALCVFCISAYFYFQGIQNEMGTAMGNSMNSMNSGSLEYSK